MDIGKQYKWLQAAVCDDETRQHICGIRHAEEGGRPVLVATDGHRLHRIEGAGMGDSVTRGLDGKPLDDADQGYPDYRKILPKTTASVVVNTNLFYSALQAVLTGWKKLRPKVSCAGAVFRFEGRKLTLSTELPGLAVSLTVPLIDTEGTLPNGVTYTTDYLNDAVELFTREKGTDFEALTLAFANANTDWNPLVIQPGPGFTTVVMNWRV